MKFLDKLFGGKETLAKKEQSKLTINEFWNWFSANQAGFLKVVKSQKNIESEFINPVFNKLSTINDGAYILAGMMDATTAELVFTAEGNLLYFPFISELVDSAPKIKDWQFTAFKPSADFPDFGINMGPLSFTTKNIFFFPDDDGNYPDEISINLVYTDDYSDDQAEQVANGMFIFLENYIGEMKTATQIDRISIKHKFNSDIELNPINKLNDYINWREKEFVEKYEGEFHNSDESNYSSIESQNGGKPIIGIVNADIIKWDKKASHPWIMVIIIKFDEHENNGLPNPEELEDYYQFEDDLRELLPDSEGHVHVAQTTGLGKREIFYANKDYNKAIQTLNDMKAKVNFEYDIEVFKDKYWRSMNQFEH